MLKFQMIGNVGRDAEVTEVNGKKAINFTVADNKKYLDSAGVEVNKTTWISCTMWRDSNQSTKVAEYIKKGVKVFVEGSPEIQMYKDKEKKTAASIKMVCINLELLSSVDDE